MDDLFLIGRVIFGGFFLYNGANHFLSNALFVQYTAAKGVPMPEIAVAIAGLLILVAGVCVLVGLWPYLGALCIALFLIGVTPIMHNFWAIWASISGGPATIARPQCVKIARGTPAFAHHSSCEAIEACPTRTPFRRSTRTIGRAIVAPEESASDRRRQAPIPASWRAAEAHEAV